MVPWWHYPFAVDVEVAIRPVNRTIAVFQYVCVMNATDVVRKVWEEGAFSPVLVIQHVETENIKALNIQPIRPVEVIAGVSMVQRVALVYCQSYRV